MSDNPCDGCLEDCVGGIIYGNCQKFLSWRKVRSWYSIHHKDAFIDAGLPSKSVC